MFACFLMPWRRVGDSPRSLGKRSDPPTNQFRFRKLAEQNKFLTKKSRSERNKLGEKRQSGNQNLGNRTRDKNKYARPSAEREKNLDETMHTAQEKQNLEDKTQSRKNLDNMRSESKL